MQEQQGDICHVMLCHVMAAILDLIELKIAPFHSIRRPRNHYTRTKHEVSWMIRCGDITIRNLTNERSVVNIYILTLISYTPLRYVRNVAKRSKNAVSDLTKQVLCL